MFVTLPAMCLMLLCVIASLHYSDFRISLLAGSVIWGMIIALLTEVLSLFNGLTFHYVIICWGVIDIILLGVFIFLVHKRRSLSERQAIGILWNNALFTIPLIVIFMIILFIALQAPPNTWDSMTYHMSRVVHWIQNRTVAFYPTHILRQNHQMPFAEYAIVHLQILSRSDRFANMIQWVSMVGSVIGVSLIAKHFGASRSLQLVTAIVCATIPMGILQASSTQNDYVTSLWLVCAIYFFMQMIQRVSFPTTIVTGVALGLALLTKGTAYVYMFPFVVMVGIILFRRSPKKAMTHFFLIGGIALLLNIGHYARNTQLYRNPLGPGQEGSSQYSYTNEKFSFPIMCSNVIRNVGLHLTTPFNQLNQMIERCIYRVLGNEVNNPLSTWGGTSFRIGKLSFHEDIAGNPLHLLLVIFSSSIVLSQDHLLNNNGIMFSVLSGQVYYFLRISDGSHGIVAYIYQSLCFFLRS